MSRSTLTVIELTADWEDGKLVGYMYVPSGEGTQVLSAEGASTSVGQYNKPCDVKCGAAVGAKVAFGISMAYGFGELAELGYGAYLSGEGLAGVNAAEMSKWPLVYGWASGSLNTYANGLNRDEFVHLSIDTALFIAAPLLPIEVIVGGNATSLLYSGATAGH